jgi:transcriptional regulator with XRE-family HTH domain
MWNAMTGAKTSSEAHGLRSVQEILLALAKRMRSERKRIGVSQEDFADDCGLHRTAIGLLERGKSIPRLDTLLLVSRRLGLTVSELLRGIEQ